MFKFRETEAFETRLDAEGQAYSKFEDAGYEQSNFIQLIGSIFFIIALFFTWNLLLLSCRLCARKYSDNRLKRWLHRPTQNKIIIIRFLLEGCIELGLSAMIQVIMTDEVDFSSINETITYSLAILTLIELVTAPIFLIPMIY